MNLNENVSFRKEDRIVWKKLENGAVIIILNLKDGTYFSLEDSTSIRIWEMVMAEAMIGDIITDLQKRYNSIAIEKLENDLEGFVQLLLENKIIFACN